MGVHADAKLHPHVHPCTFIYLEHGPLFPSRALCFSMQTPCAAIPGGISSAHVPEPVLSNPSVSRISRESMLRSHFCRPRSARPRPSTMDVVCALRVKITYIWHLVTMLALCFLGNFSLHLSGTPFAFGRNTILVTHHAALRPWFSIHAYRVSTGLGHPDPMFFRPHATPWKL